MYGVGTCEYWWKLKVPLRQVWLGLVEEGVAVDRKLSQMVRELKNYEVSVTGIKTWMAICVLATTVLSSGGTNTSIVFSMYTAAVMCM